MKRAAISVGLGLIAWLAAPSGAAAQAAAGTAAAAQERPADGNAIEAARTALAALAAEGTDRLLSDPAYAAEIIGHLDVLQGAATTPEAAMGLDTLRLTALIVLERPEETRRVVDRVLAQRPALPEHYFAPWWGALSIADLARSVTVVEQASRNVPGVGWAELRRALSREAPAALLQQLNEANDKAGRVRLAEALLRIGWPGDGDREGADFLRTIILDERLARGDRAAATNLAGFLTTPSSILSLIVLRRYDPVLAPGVDRLTVLRAALAAEDRETAEAIAAASDPARILDRVHFLRGLGRDAEALAVLEPFLRDVAATVAADEHGMWLVNEAAYALLALERKDDAVRLMARLVALPVAENGSLIGPYINHGAVLREAGRHGEALAYATRLETDFSQFANGYGKMWIGSEIVCALASLDRAGEAAPVLERMRTTQDVNPAAMSRAYLCLNDMAAAEALLIQRLESDDPESAVLALQDYQLETAAGRDPLIDRLISLRGRPAVRAALDRVGHSLALPLARTYWGGL